MCVSNLNSLQEASRRGGKRARRGSNGRLSERQRDISDRLPYSSYIYPRDNDAAPLHGNYAKTISFPLIDRSLFCNKLYVLVYYLNIKLRLDDAVGDRMKTK